MNVIMYMDQNILSILTCHQFFEKENEIYCFYDCLTVDKTMILKPKGNLLFAQEPLLGWIMDMIVCIYKNQKSRRKFKINDFSSNPMSLYQTFCHTKAQ